MDTLLDRFIDWANRNRFDVTLSTLDTNPGARADIDTDRCVGRITLWASGACDAELIDIESEKDVYRKHWQDLEGADLATEFQPFLYALFDEEG